MLNCTEELPTRPYMVMKKGLSVIKYFFLAIDYNFHNVSMYIFLLRPSRKVIKKLRLSEV